MVCINPNPHNQMERLTIKELAPYLPYGLKCYLMGMTDENTGKPHTYLIEGANNNTVEVWSLNTITDEWQYSDVFPLLRPLSQLTQEIEHNGESFVPYDVLRDMELKDMKLHSDGCLTINHRNIQNCEYWRMEKLLEWYFDVFGLIDRGLALPIDGKEVEGE